MSFEPSPKQKEVIAHRDGSLLVAAAAGSGKTTTLIAHVLDRLKEKDPAKRGDLRRMIIVTYTNKAASEMRAKLIRELGRALEKEADNSWLRLQSEIASQAHICTVDSLCGFLVRNYFDQIDLSPDIRIADEGELTLLKADVLDALMEEKYAEGTDEAFFELIGCYSTEKTDRNVRDMVIALYETAQNATFPEDWLAEAEMPQPDDEDAFWEQDWVKTRHEALADELRGILDSIEAARRRTVMSEAAKKDDFLVMLDSDKRLIESLLAADFPGLQRRLEKGLSWERKPAVSAKKDAAADIELNAVIDEERKAYKKQIEKLAASFGRSPERNFELVRMTQAPKKALIALAREFSLRFKEELKARNMTDFIGMEHYALSLLVRKTDDGTEPTPLARQLADAFDEIIIDEYQDINNVQDRLLRALSHEETGRPNLFMVGDVKQSIYRFRRANPEIFLQKYKSFSSAPGAVHRKIDLSVNYRSRREIVEGVNDIFRRIMDEPLGGIVYDENAQLNCGAGFKGEGHVPEVLLVEEEGNAQENHVREAQRIGQKIRELLETGRLSDEADPGGFRKVRLGDIQILMKAMTDARTYADTLNEMGIPAVAPMKHGFYETQEVQTVLALLRLIDNPRQDIPLAAVMTSPLGGFTDGELADIVGCANAAGGAQQAQDLLDRLVFAKTAFPERFGKVGIFLEKLAKWRDLAEVSSIPELIHALMAETGYELYLRAMPGGMVRLANLETLLDKAEAFETTSYRGLYQFNRYIERVRESTDEGEAASAADGEDAVHIDTIHSAKGLQYPVVFLANASGRFYLTDAQGPMLVHETEGVALESRDASSRQRLRNLKLDAVSERILREIKAEELRVLYVALTRAEEYLFISGAVRDAQHWWDARTACAEAAPGPLPARLIRSASSYLDWILMAAAAGTPHLKVLADTAGQEQADAVRRLSGDLGWEQLRQKMEEIRRDPAAVSEELDKRVHFRYPYESLAGVRGIVTVSALKQRAEEMPADLQEERPEELPSVRQERTAAAAPQRAGDGREKLSGAERGTVFHKIMEHLVIAKLTDEASAAAQIDRMKEKGLLSEDEVAAVPAADILAFFETPLGERVRRADAEGRLFREQPFILGVPLSELDPAHEGSRERVLIQGIIDLYFEEDGRLILADYKTDHVRDMSELEARYRTQLNYYRRALEQASGKPVAETLIYSTGLRSFRTIR